MSALYERCPNYNSGFMGLGEKKCCGREHKKEIEGYENMKVKVELRNGTTHEIQVYQRGETALMEPDWITPILHTAEAQEALQCDDLTPESWGELRMYHPGNLTNGAINQCPMRRRAEDLENQ